MLAYFDEAKKLTMTPAPCFFPINISVGDDERVDGYDLKKNQHCLPVFERQTPPSPMHTFSQTHLI